MEKSMRSFGDEENPASFGYKCGKREQELLPKVVDQGAVMKKGSVPFRVGKANPGGRL
jgi:hypothetical protein